MCIRDRLSPAHPPTQDDLDQARHLREVLRPLALAAVSGHAPPADAVTAVTAFLAGTAQDDPVRLRVVDGRLVREPPATTTAALARIARQAVDQLTGPERHHLKACPEHDCRGVFADPADRRRWCPSPACASRGRVRALRARRRAEEA